MAHVDTPRWNLTNNVDETLTPGPPSSYVQRLSCQQNTKRHPNSDKAPALKMKGIPAAFTGQGDAEKYDYSELRLIFMSPEAVSSQMGKIRRVYEESKISTCRFVHQNEFPPLCLFQKRLCDTGSGHSRTCGTVNFGSPE
eukprot:gene20217-7261_t